MVENGNRSLMCMHMRISLKEGDAHAHPIIFYSCSAHVHSVKVIDQTCFKALGQELSSEKRECRWSNG